MPATLTLSAVELVNELRSRGVMLHVNGSKLRVSSRSALTDTDRSLIREHKPELLRLLDTAVHASPEVTCHRETIPAECFSATLESWDERAVANLVAVARQAGLRLEYDSTALMIEGPSSPTELRRLLREQGAGVVVFLQRPCSSRKEAQS